MARSVLADTTDSVDAVGKTAASEKSAKSEKTAGRLLKSSATKFYDPELDIDWSAELAQDKYFIPPHRSSLYGTALWNGLSEAQRIELTKHEFASVASNGIWFEVLLMQMLLKTYYDSDPTTESAKYSLAEIADECRHSTMFAMACDRVGAPAYGPPLWLRRVAKVLPVIATGPAKYGAILVAEEILDRLQREMMSDETIQPLVRMVNRIHVLEEARHVTFAREEVLRGMPELNRISLRWQQFLVAAVSYAIAKTLINPGVYRSVGISPREGMRARENNPNWQATMEHAGGRIMGFLSDAGLVGLPGRWFWKHSFLMGK